MNPVASSVIQRIKIAELPWDAHDVNVGPSAYPPGISYFCTAASSTFPIRYGLVITINVPGSRVVQYNIAQQATDIRIRGYAGNDVWTAWRTIAVS